MKGATRCKRKLIYLGMIVVVALSLGAAPHAGAEGGLAGGEADRTTTFSDDVCQAATCKY